MESNPIHRDIDSNRTLGAAETLVPLADTTVQTHEAAVKSANSTAVKSTHSAAVETPASAMRPSVGEIWLTERGSAQQSSCDGCQSPSYPWPGSTSAYL
jgi:hypothetical protein